MYTFVEDIDKEEYEKFVLSAPKSHFMQSSNFGEIRKEKSFTPFYVGMKKDGKLVCTALLLRKKIIGSFYYYYSPRGYTIDFNDYELLKEFSACLKKYAKKNHGLFIRIDPDIKRHTLDIDGNIIEGENNYELIDKLKSLGYKHSGFNKMFENEQPRFTFRLDIDKSLDEVYANFHATTRKILNKKNKYDLELYKGDSKDIEDFYITMQETAKREGIIQAPIKYYESFYEIFNKDNQSDLYIAKVDIKHLKDIYKNNVDDINKQIEKLDNQKEKNEAKNNNRKQELLNQLNKAQKEYDEIKDYADEKIVLSSIITVKYRDMVWTVHGGNNSVLMNLNANYLVYYEIIKDALNEGYKKVDFFGTCGDANPSQDNPIYGIHSFKKRLGGEYTEFIGEFDFITNKPLYYMYKVLIPIYRKLRKMIKG